MKRALHGSGRALLLVLAFLLLCLILEHFVVHAVRISGTSMVDTLRNGDLALVTRFDYRMGGSPQRGDIVECTFPGRSGTYIKRVIGLPGERVEILAGQTYIDGTALSEPYATGAAEDYRVELGVDEYLVLGDNRAESYDSRADDMGLLHRENFLGRVRMILWPLRKLN